MRRTTGLALFVMLAASAFALAQQRAYAGTMYKVLDLGNFTPYALNNLGFMAGVLFMDDGPHAAVGVVGALIDLGPGNGYGVDSTGRAVGWYVNAEGLRRGFLWTPHDGLMELEPVGANSSEAAYDLNNAQASVGQMIGSDGVTRAILWQGTAFSANLPRVGGSATAAGINNAGHMVGGGLDASNSSRILYWPDETTVHDLGNGSAAAINNADTVTGYAYDDDRLRAFRWTATSGLVLLPSIRNTMCFGYGLNSSGTIVGHCNPEAGHSIATLWSTSNTILDLNTVLTTDGWEVRGARTINDLGLIGAEGYYQGSEEVRGVLLIPMATR